MKTKQQKRPRIDAELLSKKRGLIVLLIIIGLIIALVLVGFGIQLTRTMFFQVTAQPPRVGTTVLAPAESKAQHSLDTGLTMTDSERAATEYLAAQPTAYWLTPEQDPPGTAGGTVNSLVAQAREQGVALAVVIYGLPERDCGNHSAGGLSPEEYQPWISEISAALKLAPDLQTVVILEPDSLALAPECGNQADRVVQLSAAVKELISPATWIYLDGGHSGWLTAEQMAELITSVGVNDQIRGFATNVSNYQSSYDEFAYAAAVSERTGGLHAVVDTSRNGTASAGSDWCNPPGQRAGEPGGTYGDLVVDTNLWIKPPGESDGTCNGGPAAGVWWPAAAESLTQGLM